MKTIEVTKITGGRVTIFVDNIVTIDWHTDGCAITPTIGMVIYTNESYDSVIKKIGGLS